MVVEAVEVDDFNKTEQCWLKSNLISAFAMLLYVTKLTPVIIDWPSARLGICCLYLNVYVDSLADKKGSNDNINIPDQLSSPIMPESSPMQLSVRTLVRDIHSENTTNEGRLTEVEPKLWNQNILQRLFTSPETELVEVTKHYSIHVSSIIRQCAASLYCNVFS